MTPKKNPMAGRGRGRPQSFDREQAVGAAMRLFWERGYEGSSFDELTDVMGISPSSFYNAFGSKEQLYLEVIDVYLKSRGTWFVDILHADTDTKTTFEHLMAVMAEEFTRDDLPAGCMISASGIQCAPAQSHLRGVMCEQRAASEAAMAERLRLGVERGELPAQTDIDGLAAFFGSLARGMSVQARDGASRARLLEIARIGMQAWPTLEYRPDT